MFDIRRTRGHPVYLQIVQQLERRIASGQMAPGEGLPSVRVMASELGINPNTVVRAYRELENRGLVETRHGQGSFVAQGAGGPTTATRLLEEHARRYVTAARELGVEEERAMAAIAAIWQEGENNG